MSKKYPFGNNRRHTKTKVLIFLVILIGAVGAVAILSNFSHRSLSHTAKASVSTNTVSPSLVEGKYLFSGTIVLARDVAKYAGSDYNQPFSQMYTLGTYDAHIGVLECPITTNYDSYQNQIQNLIFNCQPSWLPTLKHYFPILDLSSDHLNDEGQQGIADTFKYLSQYGFQTVGTYNPASINDDCKAIVLPVRVVNNKNQVSNSSMPIAMCSYNYKELFSPQPGQLQSIQKWSKLMPVIALFNHGLEYQQTADSQTVDLAHQMIDYGADFVVGNGTHWVQNTEVYKGKLIVYSMGNFIFDQLDYNGRIALNLSVSLSVKYNQNVQRWINLSSRCLAQPQNCLTYAQNDKLTKIIPSYSFNAIGSYGGDATVATLANSQQQSDIERIANWSITAKQLGE